MAKSVSSGTDDGGQRRSGKPFHRPSRTVKARLKGIAARKGFAEPDVLMRWPEAVGTELSGICQPVKVSYGSGIGATLLVRTDSARAPEVEHRAPQIIDRINSFYGYRAISRLKITQATGLRGRARGFAEDQMAFDGPAQSVREPSHAAKVEAEGLARDIRDPDLRAAIARMGAWILSQPSKRKSQTETS